MKRRSVCYWYRAIQPSKLGPLRRGLVYSSVRSEDPGTSGRDQGEGALEHARSWRLLCAMKLCLQWQKSSEGTQMSWWRSLRGNLRCFARVQQPHLRRNHLDPPSTAGSTGSMRFGSEHGSLEHLHAHLSPIRQDPDNSQDTAPNYPMLRTMHGHGD